MAGLYEIWRDPAKAEDDPTRFLWTCTVLTASAEDSLGHIHDRMPMMLSRDRYERWLDPRVHDPEDLLALLEPAAPGRLEAYPVSTLVSNVKNNGRRAGHAAPARGERLMPPERMVRTPKGDARIVGRRAKRPLATLVLTHGAGGGIDAPDLLRLARTLPQQDISVTLVEMPWRVAGKRLAPAPSVIDACYTAVLDTMRTRSPLVLGRPQCRRPVGVPDRAQRRGAGRAGAVLPAAPSRPAGEVPPLRAPAHPGADAGRPGRAGCVRQAGGVPRSVDLAVVPGADHSMKVPKSAELTQSEALASRPRGDPGVGGAGDRGESKRLSPCSRL